MTPMDGSDPKGDARLAAAILGAEDAVDPRDLPPVMLGPDSTARIDESLARATCPACGSARPTDYREMPPVNPDGSITFYADPRFMAAANTAPKAADADGWDYYAQREWTRMLWRYRPGEKVGMFWSHLAPTWDVASTERDSTDFDYGPATRAQCEAFLTKPEPVKVDRAADIIRGLTDLKDSLAQARVMCDNGLAQIEAYKRQWGIK